MWKGSSILEHKRKGLTSINGIFGGSISRKLIGIDQYFFRYDYLESNTQISERGFGRKKVMTV